DNHIEAALTLQAPGTRGKLGDGDAAGLVDIKRQLLHHLRTGDQLLEISLRYLAAPNLGGGDFGLFGYDAGGKLLRRHFQREQAHYAAIGRSERAVRLLYRFICVGDVEGDIGGERRLAHAGAARDDDEVGWLQPAHAP